MVPVEQVYRNYYRKLVQRIQRLVGCPKEQAEDLAQDVFTAAISADAAIGNASGWIHGAARLASARYIRDASRRRRGSAELERWTKICDARPADAERLLDASVRLQRVVRLLQRVKPQRRRLLVMVAIEEQTVDQIARELKLHRSTASARIRGVRRMLASCTTDDPPPARADPMAALGPRSTIPRRLQAPGIAD